jgi:AraC-like DNA-binding protein
MEQHSHSSYEGVFFLDGEARLLPGAAPITAGTVLVHSPHCLHAWKPVSRVTRLVLDFDVLPPVVLPSPLIYDTASVIIGDMQRALDEVEGRQPGWEDRARCLLALVCSSLLASDIVAQDRTAAFEDASGNLATEVDQYLRDNLAHPIYLADLAGHFGISERTLTLQYRRLTGESIMARLRRIRLEIAHALLLSTDYSLVEIGQRVGMPDPPYLCRCYKRQFAQSPGKQRKEALSHSR